MTPMAQQEAVKSDAVFTGSVESIEVVEELEHRRLLVEQGKAHLLSEEESLAALRRAGRRV